MKKKTIGMLIALLASFAVAFSFTFVSATNGLASDAINGVRNVVGGAENAVEGAAKGIGNGIKTGVDATGNAARNTAEGVGNAIGGTRNSTDTSRNNSVIGTMTTNNGGTNDGYTAQRTATDATFLGISSNMWTWAILALVAIAIISLIWGYAKQDNYERTSHEDNDL